MDEGKLPNMQKLAKRGSGVRPLDDDALAGVADRVGVVCDRRERRQAQHLRLPDPRHVDRTCPISAWCTASRRASSSTTFPVSKPVIQSIRGGTSFWVTARQAPASARACSTVPVTYPPEDVPNGELLSGLPLPDIRRTMGTFYYFGTDLSRYEEGNTEFGGILKRLVFDGDVAQTELVGPPNPIVQAAAARAARERRRSHVRRSTR